MPQRTPTTPSGPTPTERPAKHPSPPRTKPKLPDSRNHRQGSEIGGRRSVVEGQKSEVIRDQRSEVRNQRSVVEGQWSVVSGLPDYRPLDYRLLRCYSSFSICRSSSLNSGVSSWPWHAAACWTATGMISSSVPEIFSVQLLSLGYSLQSIYFRPAWAVDVADIFSSSLVFMGWLKLYHHRQAPGFQTRQRAEGAFHLSEFCSKPWCLLRLYLIF